MILSICIPTFNRSQKLENTINCIASQIKEPLVNLVEVIVSDNHSTDSTDKVCNFYSKKYPFIKYHRQKINLGAERNYFYTVENAIGKYIWLISDDDYICDDAIKKIITSLQRNENIGMLFLNYQYYSIEERGTLYPSRCKANADVMIGETKDFYKYIQFANSFIASSIYNRKKWLEIAPKYYSIKDYWPQLYIGNHLIESKEKVLLLASTFTLIENEHILVSRLEKKSQGDDHFYLDAHLMFGRFVKSLKEKSARNSGINIFCKDNLWQILVYKKITIKYDISYLYQVFGKMKEIYFSRERYRFWLLDVPILFLPGFVGSSCYYLYQFLPMVNSWKFSNQKSKQFLYHVYRVVKKNKNIIFNAK